MHRRTGHSAKSLRPPTVRDRPKGTGPVPSGLGPLSEKVSGPELGPDMDLIVPEPQVISQFTLMAKHRVKADFRSDPVPFPQKVSGPASPDRVEGVPDLSVRP